MRIRRTFVFLCLIAHGFVSAVNATDFHVYFLGGQSNMEGFGYVKELNDELATEVDGVRIFHGTPAADGSLNGGKGMWSALKPGHGTGFQSDGMSNEYSDRFGVELSFGRVIKEIFPQRRIAIIKYARNGSSIAEGAAGNFGCWEPDFRMKDGINQYDHFLETLANAWADNDIDDDGIPDRLIPAGIVWMQGESDAAFTSEIAHQYQANLRRLMDLIRAALRVDDVPVVIGRISYSTKDPPVWTHGEIVRAAQAAYVAADSHAALIKATDDYDYSDRWHYDTAGYIDLGKRFAESIARLDSAMPTE